MKRKLKNKNKIVNIKPAKGMSETLLDFAWTYAIQDAIDPIQRQYFMNVACYAWNFSLLPDDECQKAITTYLANLTAGRDQVDEANIEAIGNDIRALIAWKKDQYPNIRKLVVSAELYDDEGGKVGCRTTSGDYDAMVRAKLAR